MKQFCSFSEAIREGAKLTAQAFGRGIGLDGASTCAWGAGVHAITGTLEEHTFKQARPLTMFPYLADFAKCPACKVEAETYSVIYHLNDVHQWGRNAIADWLESEEEKLGFVTLTEGKRSESSVHSLQTLVV